LDRVWLQREENKKENKNKQEKEELQYWIFLVDFMEK
jgi:hypothetical protein